MIAMDLDPRRELLLVEDEEDQRQLLAEALRQRGYEVVVAADAEAAMTQFELRSPSIAVIDLGLPGIDGLKLASMLRVATSHAPSLLLVALTGFGMMHDRVMAAGYDHYLLKPIDMLT